MSSSVDDHGSRDAEARGDFAAAARLPRRPGTTTHEHHHHHILIEPEEDRWRWRRKIREDKRKLAVYRVAVGLLGLILSPSASSAVRSPDRAASR